MIKQKFELELRRRDFHKLIQNTIPNFVDGWIYFDISNRLRKFMLDVREGKSPRLILCMPPRMGKSVISSMRFPLYCLLNNPTWEIIVTTYSQSLVNRFSRFTRNLLESDPYIKKMWPNASLAKDHAAVEEWRVVFDKNKKIEGGTYRAVSKGSSLTGSGSSVICIDDTCKDAEEANSVTSRENLWDWYSSVARTRLAPGGGILITQTRWNPDDLVGKLLKEEKNTEGADHWELIEYKAIAEQDEKYRKAGESILPERWTIEQLLKTKASMIPRYWDALYQQRPVAAGGNLIKEDWIKEWSTLPEMDQVIQVWDLRFGKSQAKTSSFVVGWVIGKCQGNYYLIHEVRGRWSYAETRNEILALSEKFPAAIAKVIENKANGAAIESDLEDQVEGIILFNPRGDKIQRAERILPILISGNFYIPINSRDIKNELTAFPNGADDDRVDVLSMGLSWFYERDSATFEVYSL